MKGKRNLGVLSPSEHKKILRRQQEGVFGTLSPGELPFLHSEIKKRGYKYFPDNDSYGVKSPSEIKTKGK